MRLPILRGRTILFGLLMMFMLESAVQAGTFSADSRKALTEVESQIRASQFLSRATFGATKPEIQSLALRIQDLGARAAFDEWIEQQFALEATSHHQLAKDMIIADGWPDNFVTSGLPTTSYRHYAWWDTAITAPDQLRQRMAWALAQIFVINDFNGNFNSRSLDASGQPRYLGVVDYYDMLIENAFGNYRQTLEDVTLHPVMGVFLSHLRNAKADPDAGTYPDENYAREIQQLFSIGLYDIKRNGDYVLDRNKDPVPAYDNEDIVTFARVFTGLNYAGTSSISSNAINYHAPMIMHDNAHDMEEKVLHNGVVLPARQIDGMQDIDAALDNLFQHDNVGPFISRLLIQRFVKSNPTSRYIDAVAAAFNDNGTGIRGDFKAVLKEILLNPEAMESYTFQVSRKNLTLTVKGGGTEHSRLQEPVLRYTAFFRNFGATSTHLDAVNKELTGYFPIPDRSFWLNQEPYRSPSVFNYYLPNHVPGGALQTYRPKGRVPNKTVYAPEFQLMTSVATNLIANAFRNDVRDAELDLGVRQYNSVTGGTYNLPVKIQLDFTEETNLASDPAALFQHLDILMCHGSMSDTTRNSVAGIVEATTTDTTDRAKGAILALLAAPDCVVHE